MEKKQKKKRKNGTAHGNISFDVEVDKRTVKSRHIIAFTVYLTSHKYYVSPLLATGEKSARLGENVLWFLNAFLWSLHYIRRTAEVILLHEYKRTDPIAKAIGSGIYYGLLGALCGWCTHVEVWKRYGLPSKTMMALGLLIFALGEIGNCYHHFLLARMRPLGVSGHVIPIGGFFELVSCPHYTFEICTWIGYVLWTGFTYGSLLMLLASCVILFGFAKKRHQEYVKEFNGKGGRPLYPTHRRMLIPFILGFFICYKTCSSEKINKLLNTSFGLLKKKNKKKL
ncbi:hypothetical protein RFI_23529 [Reticulomyxa filosa]|uniref:3-oxo-5-alpha-steroid 4-dehydrogenase C-terminal domain-containing protein n=1 Tax=Reticulomyxa filosa TaxID=46433 RepID=X6MIZ1_RETFI|nr:hypothetical protein RFI_23529 [Reticulomyxa filosa]|eukprot:ETO13839.1 hypothetical protein RFI_23529 [Reticulomyxa filosa]